MEKILTLRPTPRARTNEPLAVVGSGIIGLHTAIHAQDLGYDVRIYSANPPKETTSAKAGASFMPHQVEGDIDEMVGMGWGIYERIAHDHPDAGVHLQTRWEVSRKPKELSSFHRVIAQDLDVIDNPAEIPGRYPHALRYKTFTIDTPKHMAWLEGQFHARGGRTARRRFTDLEQLTELPEEVIVNATGLGARELFSDSKLEPIKGQIVVVDAIPGMDYTVSADGFYVYPHSDRTLLGGTVEKGVENDTVDPEVAASILLGNYAVLSQHVPDLGLLGEQTRYAGLRPYRRGSVRIETEELGGKLIVHNYGHGGSGITLAPGSVRQALALAS